MYTFLVVIIPAVRNITKQTFYKNDLCFFKKTFFRINRLGLFDLCLIIKKEYKSVFIEIQYKNQNLVNLSKKGDTYNLMLNVKNKD